MAINKKECKWKRNHALLDFLDKHNARCLWEKSSGSTHSMQSIHAWTLRAYIINGRIVMVQEFMCGGFDFFVPATDSLKTDETLKAVEKAVGL
jgi:hypothetical protein